jgi:hypothetical protein
LRCYNVASGEPHTVGEMAAALASGFGGIEPVVTGEYRLGDVRHIVASPESAARGPRLPGADAVRGRHRRVRQGPRCGSPPWPGS